MTLGWQENDIILRELEQRTRRLLDDGKTPLLALLLLKVEVRGNPQFVWFRARLDKEHQIPAVMEAFEDVMRGRLTKLYDVKPHEERKEIGALTALKDESDVLRFVREYGNKIEAKVRELLPPQYRERASLTVKSAFITIIARMRKHGVTFETSLTEEYFVIVDENLVEVLEKIVADVAPDEFDGYYIFPHFAPESALKIKEIRTEGDAVSVKLEALGVQ